MITKSHRKSIPRILSELLFSLTIIASFIPTHSFAAKSIFSKVPLKRICESEYLKAKESYQDALENGMQINANYLDMLIRTVRKDCHLEYSLGLADAQLLVLKNILAEYSLEIDYLYKLDISPRVNKRNYRINYLRDLFDIYEKRLEKINIDSNILNSFYFGSKNYKQVLNEVTTNLASKARKDKGLIKLGRFVFTGHIDRPLTLYNYEIGFYGKIVFKTGYEPNVIKGTYQLLIEQNLDALYKVVREYSRWRPGMVISTDSFFYGSWENIYGEQINPRVAKENGFADLVTLLINRAIKLKVKVYAHKLDSDGSFNSEHNSIGQHFFFLKDLFFKMQLGRIERDAKLFATLAKRMKQAIWQVPLGLAIGTWSGIRYGYSLITAKNITAAISLGTMATYAGINTYHAYQEAKTQKLPFNASNLIDVAVTSSILSVPLAAAAPTVFHMSASFFKSLAISTIELTSLEWSTVKQVLNTKVTTEVLKSWWKKEVLVNIGVDTAANIIFQLSYREYYLQGNQRFFQRDKNGNWIGINPNAKYSLVGGVIFSFFALPVLRVKNIILQQLLYRMVALSSGYTFMAVSGIYNGQAIDYNKLQFDALFGAASTPINVLEGNIRYGKAMEEAADKIADLHPYLQNRHGGADKQRIKGDLLFLFSLSLKAFYTFGLKRAEIFDYYLEDPNKAASFIRHFYLDKLKVDLRDYSDAEISDSMMLVIDPERFK